MNLDGKTAVVTGAGSGMGLGTCKEFVAAGANVVLFDLNEKALIAACEELGEKATYAVVDVSSETDVEAGVKKAIDTFGAIHICVNCAGMPSATLTINRKGLPHPLDKFRRVIEVNLIGTFNVARLCAAEMIKNELDSDDERGVIINVSSGAAQDGQAGQASYSSSKAGVEGLALPLARDLARHRIRINTISPGLFDTLMVQNLPANVRDEIVASIPCPRRMGQPSDFGKMARAVVENAYLNTACIRLDAGVRLAAKI